MNIDILGMPPSQHDFDSEITKAENKIKRNYKLSVFLGVFILATTPIILFFTDASGDSKLMIAIANFIGMSISVINFNKLNSDNRNIYFEFVGLAIYMSFLLLIGDFGGLMNHPMAVVLLSVIITTITMGFIDFTNWLIIEGSSTNVIHDMKPIKNEYYIEIKKYTSLGQIEKYCEKIGFQNRSITNIEYSEICDFYTDNQVSEALKDREEEATLAKNHVFKRIKT